MPTDGGTNAGADHGFGEPVVGARQRGLVRIKDVALSRKIQLTSLPRHSSAPVTPRRIKKLLDLLLDDEIDMAEGKAEMKALDARRKELEVQLKAADEPPPLLHPSMADLYRSKVEGLASALQREDTRLEASEMLRGLIDSIVLTPEKGQLRIELRGNLAAMFTAAQKTKRSPETGDLLVPVQMVAGARNHLDLEFAWAAA
jgi:site-specific DNA recombinase